jgi:hypothetical protein
MRSSNAAAACALCLGALSLGIAAGVQAQSPYTSPEFNNTAPNMRGDGPSLTSKPFSITRTDPALDALISPQGKLEMLADHFGLTEGPVWIPDGKQGYLVVADLIANVLYKITLDHTVSVFLDKAGYSGNDINNAGAETRRGRAYVLMVGPNGTTLDAASFGVRPTMAPSCGSRRTEPAPCWRVEWTASASMVPTTSSSNRTAPCT